jgi:hypothetical protein
VRSLLAAIALVAVTAGCAGPAPTGVPVTLTPGNASGPPPTASTSSPTPPSTEVPMPTPTMTAFRAPYPDKGWVVASAVDGTGDVERVITYGWVKAGALLDFAYTCEHTATISVVVSDGRATAAEDTLFRLTGPCSPGEPRRASAPSTSTAMPINLDVTIDPAVRFWVKLGVPTDHLLR